MSKPFLNLVAIIPISVCKYSASGAIYIFRLKMKLLAHVIKIP